MKRRLMAVLLALGVSVCGLSAAVSAAEAQTETESAAEDENAQTEAQTEAAEDSGESETAAEASTEAAEDAGTEAVSEAAETEAGEASSEAASKNETEASSEASSEGETEAQTETESAEDQMKEIMTYYLSQVDAWTEEQVDELAEGTDSWALIALNWQAVRGELGSFEEVTDAEHSSTDYAIIGHASYSGAADSATITVTLSYSVDSSYSISVSSIEWEVSYPMGVQMQRAALNTVMGIGIVFLALLFLSWVIGKLHYIPDLIESRKKQSEPEEAPVVPVFEPEPEAPAEEEISPADDLELVAVITAAIAAAEGKTSTDGYVVRSIRKINKNNWRRA